MEPLAGTVLLDRPEPLVIRHLLGRGLLYRRTDRPHGNPAGRPRGLAELPLKLTEARYASAAPQIRRDRGEERERRKTGGFVSAFRALPRRCIRQDRRFESGASVDTAAR